MRRVQCLTPLFLLLLLTVAVHAETPLPVPNERAPMQQYQFSSSAEEVALALTAAPDSVSHDAEVLVLGPQGYESAQKGKNGFVCLVERAWANEPSSPDFWNPRTKAPMCLNPPAVRTVLPEYLTRTKWVIAGVSKDEILKRLTESVEKKTFVTPAEGAECYMMSKGGHLNDEAGHWHPHIMFFVPRATPETWGANADNSPVIASQGDPEPVTTLMIPVGKWSDGTASE